MTLYEQFLGDYKFEPILNPVIYNGKRVGILADGGHGIRKYTKGKCNFDRSIYEGEWARKRVANLIPALRSIGFDARCVVPEDKDISIGVRAARANAIAREEPEIAWFYLSMHLNAVHGGEYAWKNTASGICAYCSLKSSAFSKKWAKAVMDKGAEWGLKGNRDVPDEGYYQANYTVIAKTDMPAILAENLFMTNKQEAQFLLSEKGENMIDSLHIAVLCDLFGVPYAVKFD